MGSRGKWTAYVDESSGQTYYYNADTQESRWTAPGWINTSPGVWTHEDTGELRTTDPAWQVFYDSTHEAPYWYNTETDERTWERPPHAVPWVDPVRRSSTHLSTATSAAAGTETPSRAGRINAVRALRAEGARNFRKSIAVHALSANSSPSSATIPEIAFKPLNMSQVLEEETREPKMVSFQRPPTPAGNIDSMVALTDRSEIFTDLITPRGKRSVIPAGFAQLQQDAVQAGVEAGSPFVSSDVEVSLLSQAYAALLAEYRKKFLTPAQLAKLAFFSGLSQIEAKTVASCFTLWACPSGTPVITAGDLHDCLFLVVQGSLHMYTLDPEYNRMSSAFHTHSVGIDAWEPETSTVNLSGFGSGVIKATLSAGTFFGAQGLVAENARSVWTAVGVAGAAREGSSTAAQTICSVNGSCHILVLSLASLYATFGANWVLMRRLSLLTGVQGPLFAAPVPSVWHAIGAASSFSGATAGAATTALLRGSTVSGLDGAQLIGHAVGSNVALVGGSDVALASLALLLTESPYLSKCDSGMLDRLSKHGVIVRKQANMGVMYEGHTADAFVVVIHGSVRVMRGGIFLMSAGPGFYAGEYSLVNNTPSKDTIITASETLLFMIPKAAWDRFAKRNVDTVDMLVKESTLATTTCAAWRELKVFSALTDAQLDALARSARVVRLERGQKLQVSRLRMDGCFVVVQGELLVELEDLETCALPGRVIGLHNIVSTGYGDPLLSAADTLVINATAKTDATLVRVLRSDIIQTMGGLEAAVSMIGNFEGTAALLAALSNEAHKGELAANDVVLYDVASLSVLARCKRLCAIIDGSMQLDVSVPTEIIQFIQACDSFTQRAIAMSPSGAPIVLPPASLTQEAAALFEKFLGESSAVKDVVPDDVRAGIAAFLYPSAPSPLVSSGTAVSTTLIPVTLFADAVGALDVHLCNILKVVRSSMAARQLIENILVPVTSKGFGKGQEPVNFLDAEYSQSLFDASIKKGTVARFIANKLNRFGRWQGRVLTVRLDSCDVIVHETAGEASHRFKLTSIASVQRVSKDASGRQLCLYFSDEVDKDYLLRFDDAPTRETFCTLVNLLEPKIPIFDDCIVHTSAGKVSYEVMLVTRGVNQRRVLTLDVQRRMLTRSRPERAGMLASQPKLASSIVGAGSIPEEDEEEDADDDTKGSTKEFPITVSTRLQPSLTDPLRVKFSFGWQGEAQQEVFEVMFYNHAVRDHFCSTIRLITWNVDAPVARTIGFNRSGIAPDVLSVFTGTYNVGDMKPPKDLTTLGHWIPAHRYDVIAIGLQECNARDEWLKAIETILKPSNAPPATQEAVPFSNTGTCPAPASMESGELTSPEVKTETKSGGLFSRIRGKTDKPEPKEVVPATSKSSFVRPQILPTPADTRPRTQLHVSDPMDLLGFSRNPSTGTPQVPTHLQRSFSVSSTSLRLGPESTPRVSSKATRMLGVGASTPSPGAPSTRFLGRDPSPGAPTTRGLAGDASSTGDSTTGPRRPDPPISASPYVLVTSASLWGIHLLVFARTSVAEHITDVQTGTAATGIAGVLGNKGGVGCGFVYKEATSIAFVTAHLAARAERLRERGENYADICKNLRLATSTSSAQFLHHFQHIFFFGDLNYRIDMGNMGTVDEFTRVQQLAAANNFSALASHDQLLRETDSGRLYAGFEEGNIAFWPTYRMEKGKDEYNNKKFQNPSYTDRVLWRSRAKTDMHQLYYDATFSLNISDHRPVGAGFLLCTRVPYANLDRWGSSAVAKQATSISLCQLRYDDVVLPKADQAQASIGLDVENAVSTIQRARAKVLTSVLDDKETNGDWGANSSVTVSASGGFVGPIGSMPQYLQQQGALIDADSISNVRPDDYYIELSASFIEEITTAFGQALTSKRQGRAGAPQVSNSAVAAAVSGSAVLTALAAAMEEPTTATPAPSGSLSAVWHTDAIPDMVAHIPDVRWLQDQHLLATLKRKGGVVVAQAEIPLADAYACIQQYLPSDAESLSLSGVLCHPVLARMFYAYAVSRMCSETIDLYRAILAFQELCAPGPLTPPNIRLIAAHSIGDTFLWDPAPRMVSVSGTLIGKLRTTLASADKAFGFVWDPSGTSNCAPAEAFTDENVASDMFAEIAQEVFRTMERDLMPGFRAVYAAVVQTSGIGAGVPGQSVAGSLPLSETDRLAGKATKTKSGTPYAPFAVPFIRDGCTVGLLRGGVMLSTLDALGERSARLQEVQRFLRRRSSVHKIGASGEVQGGPTIALEDAPVAAVSAKISNFLFGPTSSAGAVVAPTPALHLNNIATLMKLGTQEQATIKELVDMTLGAGNFNGASEDFLLLADIVMGCAVAERSAGPRKDGAVDRKAALAVLQRAASMAIGASSGDRSLTTRALRMVLQLMMHWVNELDATDKEAPAT